MSSLGALLEQAIRNGETNRANMIELLFEVEIPHGKGTSLARSRPKRQGPVGQLYLPG